MISGRHQVQSTSRSHTYCNGKCFNNDFFAVISLIKYLLQCWGNNMRVIANVYMKKCFESGFKIIRSKNFLWPKIIKQPLLLKIRDDMCFIQKGSTNNLIFFPNNSIFWWITLYKTRNYPLHTAPVRSSPTAVKDVFTVSSSDDVTKKGRNSKARLFEMVYNPTPNQL